MVAREIDPQALLDCMNLLGLDNDYDPGTVTDTDNINMALALQSGLDAYVAWRLRIWDCCPIPPRDHDWPHPGLADNDDLDCLDLTLILAAGEWCGLRENQQLVNTRILRYRLAAAAWQLRLESAPSLVGIAADVTELVASLLAAHSDSGDIDHDDACDTPECEDNSEFLEHAAEYLRTQADEVEKLAIQARQFRHLTDTSSQ